MHHGTRTRTAPTLPLEAMCATMDEDPLTCNGLGSNMLVTILEGYGQGASPTEQHTPTRQSN